MGQYGAAWGFRRLFLALPSKWYPREWNEWCGEGLLDDPGESTCTWVATNSFTIFLSMTREWMQNLEDCIFQNVKNTSSLLELRYIPHVEIPA